MSTVDQVIHVPRLKYGPWVIRQAGEWVGDGRVGIGGLGHLAVQYAKAAGFATIAISHSADKDKLVRELGARRDCA